MEELSHLDLLSSNKLESFYLREEKSSLPYRRRRCAYYTGPTCLDLEYPFPFDYKREGVLCYMFRTKQFSKPRSTGRIDARAEIYPLLSFYIMIIEVRNAEIMPRL